MANTTEIEKPALFGMVYSPIRQIERIKKQPIFWVALISFCLLTSLFYGITGYFAVNDPAYIETIPQDIRSQGVVENVKMTSLSIMVSQGFLGGLLVPLFGSIALWVISRLLRGTGTFRQFFSFQVYLFSIYVLSFFVQAIIMLIMGEQLSVSPMSLAAILPMDGIAKQILSNLDLFTVWIAILLYYGMKGIGQLSAVKSSFIVVLYLLFIVVISVLAA